MNTARQLIVKVTKVTSWISMLSLTLMMFLTAGDVIGRYLFSRPITGAKDLTQLLLIVAVFTAIAFVQVNKGHVSIDLVVSKLSERSRNILATFTSFISIIIFAIIAWRLAIRAQAAFLDLAYFRTEELLIILGPFYLIASIGCFLLCLVLITDFVYLLWKLFKRTDS